MKIVRGFCIQLRETLSVHFLKNHGMISLRILLALLLNKRFRFCNKFVLKSRNISGSLKRVSSREFTTKTFKWEEIISDVTCNDT